MKKILAVVAFMAFTLLGTNSAFAQSTPDASIQSKAKGFTHTLTKRYQLKGEQQRAIFKAFTEKEQSIKGIKATDNKDYIAKKELIINTFNEQLKGALTEEQFSSYMSEKKIR